MASIEEIIAQLQGAGLKAAESVQLLNAAENTAGQIQAQMAAAGVRDKVAKFAAVRTGSPGPASTCSAVTS